MNICFCKLEKLPDLDVTLGGSLLTYPVHRSSPRWVGKAMEWNHIHKSTSPNSPASWDPTHLGVL